MPRSVSRQLYSVAPNSNRTAYPPAEEATPTLAQIRQLLRGYDDPGVLIPNSALIVDENSTIDILRCGTLYADNIEGLDIQDQTWTDTTPTTETVGGITAGTTLTGLNSIEILERMLYAYQTVAFTTFNTGLGTTTIELGTSIGGGNRSTSWTANNSSNIVTNGISVTYTGISSGEIVIVTNGISTTYTGIASGEIVSGLPYFPTTLALNYPSFSSNTIGSTLTFTIRADQQEGADATRSQVYTWRSKIYVGKNENADYTQLNNFNQLSNTVSSLITSSSSPAVSGLEIGEGAGYVYIFVHSSLNNITSIAIGSTDQTSAFQLVNGSYSMTNSTGQASTYKVYRSFNKINGDIILNIT